MNPEDNRAAVAAIQFALDCEEGLAFLRCWNQGDFDTCRKEWPEAPAECYVGADPESDDDPEVDTDPSRQLQPIKRASALSTASASASTLSTWD